MTADAGRRTVGELEPGTRFVIGGVVCIRLREEHGVFSGGGARVVRLPEYEYDGVDADAIPDDILEYPADKLMEHSRTRVVPPKTPVGTKHGVAGDTCEFGNECGRIGCPECQQ